MYGLTKIANEFEDNMQKYKRHMDLKKKYVGSKVDYLKSGEEYVDYKNEYVNDKALVGAGLGTIPGLLGVAAANTIYRRKPLPKNHLASTMIGAMQEAPALTAAGFGVMGSLPGIIGGQIYGNETFDKKKPEYKENLDQSTEKMISAYNDFSKSQI